MINAHEFQQAAKQFRAGRISLKEFTDFVMAGSPTRKPNKEAKRRPSAAGGGDQPAQADDSTAPSSVNESPALTPISPRPSQAHKGDFGRVLAIGGSAGMAGAIGMTGLAALRSGSGLVKVAVPEMVQGVVSVLNPCLMTIGCLAEGDYFHGASENVLSQHAEWADVVALGPGMGRGDAQKWIVKKLYAELQQPMVVDADGLNSLVDGQVDLNQHEGQRVLTPHPGEFQRLAGTRYTNRAKMEAAATQLADSANVVVVLKGSKTFVTDGKTIYRNQSGNPGMATAGSGDVLTGVITSLIGQGLSPFEAAKLGVNLHGAAGDFAAESVGEASLIATDVIDALSLAFKKHSAGRVGPIGF
ncbi:MAG: ADP-dependent NAD(P)H-hydrate dehydratase [Mariniblastus sp.]|jgi:ADP-dependent NAD(P)H-hydrate dehydratase